MLIYLGIGAASIIGTLLQGMMGFGYGVFIMAFLPMLMGNVPEAAAVCSLASVLCTGSQLYRHRGGSINWRLFLPLMVGCLIFLPLGAYLQLHVPVRQMKLALGVMLLLLGIYYLTDVASRARIPSSWPFAVGAGALGGMLSGLFSMGGPPAVIYMLNAAQDKNEYIVTLQTYFLVNGVYGSIIRACSGVLTLALWPAILAAVAGIVIGLAAGGRLFGKLDWERLKKSVYLFISAIGVYMIASNLLG